MPLFEPSCPALEQNTRISKIYGFFMSTKFAMLSILSITCEFRNRDEVIALYKVIGTACPILASISLHVRDTLYVREPPGTPSAFRHIVRNLITTSTLEHFSIVSPTRILLNHTDAQTISQSWRNLKSLAVICTLNADHRPISNVHATSLKVLDILAQGLTGLEALDIEIPLVVSEWAMLPPPARFANKIALNVYAQAGVAGARMLGELVADNQEFIDAGLSGQLLSLLSPLQMYFRSLCQDGSTLSFRPRRNLLAEKLFRWALAFQPEST